MKEEFLEVYSPEGTKTGQKKSKSEIHRKGLFHSTVHVWIFTEEGNILIQKRSKKKVLNPGVWDVSVAGHIKFNENIKKAAKRETLEETGININTKDFDFLIISNVDLELSKNFFLKVNHRHRVHGKSKYGTIDRLIKGIIDIFRVLIIKYKLNNG